MNTASHQRAELGCKLVAEAAHTFGSARLKVTGASMIPAIWPGDVVMIQRGADELQPGQIVLYRRAEKLMAHRIVRAGNGSITTRGDTLPDEDPPVLEPDIVGHVVGIDRNGRPARLMQSRWQLAFSSLLRRSDFCLRMALRWHNRMRRMAWAV